MTGTSAPDGGLLFARYAFPPNELGYCGPADTGRLPDDGPAELARHVREFDGAWPYLAALAAAAGTKDALDLEVVRNYWVGGPLLDKVGPDDLLATLRTAFTGQVTGLLDELEGGSDVLAHHSFHVFVGYPWVRFLDRDPTTPLRVLQDCRVRWGTVQAVDGDHAVIVSRPLVLSDRALALGDAVPERVRWRKNGASLAPAPRPGETVSAHWDWLCDTLSDAECAALADATRRTLELVNTARH